MDDLVAKLQKDYPWLTFVRGKLLCWSPGEKQIFYDPDSGEIGMAGVLHEIGHAQLEHRSYANDVDLLQKEALAWEKAVQLARKYDLRLSEAHIQDCLDSYRDWVHKRSTCPLCAARGLQQDDSTYRCVNCGDSWHVTDSRFVRPYRKH